MFNQKQKQEYLNGKIYTKKGKQGFPLGQIVKIDWDLKDENDYMGGVNYLTRIDIDTREWIDNNDMFIVTDFHNFGLSSTVTLDHRISVSGYRVYSIQTNEYIYKFPAINGDGIFKNNQRK